MRQVKNIQNLSELQTSFQKPDSLGSTFGRLLGQFHFSQIYKLLDNCKSKGVDPRTIFEIIFLFPFIGIASIPSLIRSGFSSELSNSKDVYYEFINNSDIEWRKIVYNFARQFNRIVRANSVDGDTQSPKCLIVDDSILGKTGKKIEFIGKVFDHCNHIYQLGMKILLLGLWDGKSFIPLDFSIHHEAGKKKTRGLKVGELKKQYSKHRLTGQASYERIEELSKSKIDVAVQMIRRVIIKGFVPQYVLADAWVSTDSFIKAVYGLRRKKKKKIHIIGLMKTNRLIQYNGKTYKANTLPDILRKHIKNSRKLKSSYIVVPIKYKGHKLKVFFVKIRGQQSWKLLITTDHSLSFTKAMQYYQIRWSIEVFFKDAKQNLYLGKCQSNDFDAHLATISMTLMNYMVLALAKRFESYESIGQIFIALKDKLLEATLVKKIWKLLLDIYFLILAELGVDWELFVHKIIEMDKTNPILNHYFNFLFICNQNNKKLSLT